MMADRTRCGLLAALLIAATGTAHAEVLDINLSGDTARLAISGPLSRVINSANGEYDVGGLFGDDDRDDNIVAVHAGALLTGDAGARQANVTAGLGARLQYINGDRDDGGALELGGRVEVRVPGYERIGFSAYAWYGPEPASFGDVEDVFEYAAALDYQLLRDAALYVGDRKLSVDVDRPRDLEEDGVHGGIRLNF